MKVAVTGSSGFLGSALLPFLTKSGCAVTPVVRAGRKAANDDILWSPTAKEIDIERLADHDAVVHLAGENTESPHWNRKKKDAIRNSRVEGTRFLAESIAAHPGRIRVLLCASAVSIYGDRQDEVLTDSAQAGNGFLAETFTSQEAVAEAATAAGIRVVHLRFGAILSPAGGSLKAALGAARMGLLGAIGSGNQWVSWISMDDAVRAVQHLLMSELRGPVNVVSPGEIRNRDFAAAIAASVGRPLSLPIPAIGVRVLFGAVADELLLPSRRARPLRLAETGFTFLHPEITRALEGMQSAQQAGSSPASFSVASGYSYSAPGGVSEGFVMDPILVQSGLSRLRPLCENLLTDSIRSEPHWFAMPSSPDLSAAFAAWFEELEAAIRRTPAAPVAAGIEEAAAKAIRTLASDYELWSQQDHAAGPPRSEPAAGADDRIAQRLLEWLGASPMRREQFMALVAVIAETVREAESLPNLSAEGKRRFAQILAVELLRDRGIAVGTFTEDGSLLEPLIAGLIVAVDRIFRKRGYFEFERTPDSPAEDSCAR